MESVLVIALLLVLLLGSEAFRPMVPKVPASRTSSVALNDGGLGAVGVPLAISAFTMVPFLWYQQQLKPKERTVKQIELDDTLKAKNKADSKGKASKAGEARAAKKK